MVVMVVMVVVVGTVVVGHKHLRQAPSRRQSLRQRRRRCSLDPIRRCSHRPARTRSFSPRHSVRPQNPKSYVKGAVAIECASRSATAFPHSPCGPGAGRLVANTAGTGVGARSLARSAPRAPGASQPSLHPPPMPSSNRAVVLFPGTSTGPVATGLEFCRMAVCEL